ncbi:hypothetical protein MSAN_00846300 [Mycena sanguinolenta]|uniref:Uncharacterized protein n=1 Tax=Mycena sanguinolenta TaxID=230812 RepID=A0A8H6YZX0_9AGAR|nr:hypothetical protein MSAN_00846300 [Mycena sanguinolenta]
MDLRSISSRLSEGDSSLYTTTSSSTQWGPGALAGKAFRAMGKAVLRSAEHIVISRRLSAIRAALPRLEDDQQICERMFDDLLELSRLALYPEAFRVEAMQMLVAQIASEDTYYLWCSFSKWEIDHEELVAFLSEIIGVVLFSKRGFADERLVNIYMMALPKDRHPWLPCIRFMTTIAQFSDSLLHAVVAARFLEMVLWVSGSQILSKKPDNLLADACSEAFTVLSHPPAHDPYVLWVEQIGGLVSENWAISLPKVLDCIAAQHLWPVVEARLLRMHTDAMLELILQHWQSFRVHHIVYSSNRAFSGAFSTFLPRLAVSHPQVPLTASFMRNFLRCVGIGGDVHDKTSNYLSGLTYEKKVVVLAAMIGHLIVQSHVEPSVVDSSMILFTPEVPDIASNIVQFPHSRLEFHRRESPPRCCTFEHSAVCPELLGSNKNLRRDSSASIPYLPQTTPILAGLSRRYIETFEQYQIFGSLFSGQ